MRSGWIYRATVLAVCALLPAGLTGCIGLAIGGAATAGSAAMEERGLGGALVDTRIRAAINEKWLQSSFPLLRNLDLTVQEGRVLVTGSVPTTEMRLEAVRLVWQVDGVREVINEVQVGDGGGVVDYARDVWIASQLRSNLVFDRRVQSVNYSIETIDGVVYLMGVAQNQAELDRVTNYARNLRYVKRVVSYMRIKDQPGATSPAGTAASRATPVPAAAPAVAVPSAADAPVPAPMPGPPPARAPVEAEPLPSPAAGSRT